VAWAALKAGKLDEAKAAIADALVLDTVDPRLFYHAGMIAKATGDAAGAKSFLEKALDTSPQFDPMQAKLAREALGRA
jgi:Tfp pilus assembly protein PilF